MSAAPALAVALALASALAFAVAEVVEQHTAAATSDEDVRAGRFARRLVRDRRWWGGMSANLAAYGLQAAALAVGTVVLVQPILVTSLLFALPLAARLARRPLPARAAVSGVVLTLALAVFVVVGEPDRGVSRGSGRAWLVTLAVGGPAVLLCLARARRRTGAARAVLLAVAVGLLGGALAVLTKSVVDAAGHGVVAVLTSGETYALLAVGAAGIYLQQLAFQAGALQTSLPVMLVLEPVVAAALGLTLLHEQLDAGGARLVLLAASAAAMTVTTVQLARVHAGTPRDCSAR